MKRTFKVAFTTLTTGDVLKTEAFANRDDILWFPFRFLFHESLGPFHARVFVFPPIHREDPHRIAMQSSNNT